MFQRFFAAVGIAMLPIVAPFLKKHVWLAFIVFLVALVGALLSIFYT